MRVYIFGEYSKIFGEYTDETILRIVKNIDFKTGCRVLSLLGHYSKKHDKKVLDEHLLKFVQVEKINEIRKYLQETLIVSRHGVLLSWKYVLANCDKCDGNANDIDGQIGNILKLILIMHEKYMIEDTNEMQEFAAANALFNYYDNAKNQVARSYYIFVKNRMNRSNIDIQRIENKFIDNYGISIENYIYMVVMITGHMNCRNNYRHKEKYFFADDWRIDPYSMRGVSKDIIGELIQLLDKISFDYTEGQAWSQEHIREVGEFSMFMNKPLIKLSDDCYIPIEHKIMEDLIFNQLFRKIKYCYKGNQEFSNDFGHIFQEYVEYISTEVCNMSQGYYKAIPEFLYGRKKARKASPDFMILHEEEKMPDTVLVIEVKSQRTIDTINDYMNLESSELDKSVKTLVKVPLCQSITAINDIIEKKCSDVITDDKVYYFFAVTMNNLPFDLYNSKTIEQKILSCSSLKVGGFESIGIEEFELLLQVLCFPGAKPFGWYIQKYRECATECSFKNFIKDFDKAKDIKNIHKRYLDPITNLADECFENSCIYFLDENSYNTQ